MKDSTDELIEFLDYFIEYLRASCEEWEQIRFKLKELKAYQNKFGLLPCILEEENNEI